MLQLAFLLCRLMVNCALFNTIKRGLFPVLASHHLSCPCSRVYLWQNRNLLHKSLQKQGIDDFSLSAIQRLSIVGNGGMGALTYVPQTMLCSNFDDCDFDVLQQKALQVLSEKNDDDASLLLFNSRNSGGCRPKTLYADADGHWLVKFRHTYDPLDIGKQEYAYKEAARKCGIVVPDFKLIKDKYFASKRFDILPNGERLHVITVGALLNIALDNPVLDYSNLLALTGFLTHNSSDVEQMFRRMVFNYLTDNKDDHCKNFSFYMRRDIKYGWQWRLAPAYDLTLCTDGYNGEHATSVNGTGRPSANDIVAVGAKVGINVNNAMNIIKEMQRKCAGLVQYPLV